MTSDLERELAAKFSFLRWKFSERTRGLYNEIYTKKTRTNNLCFQFFFVIRNALPRSRGRRPGQP